MFDPTLPTALKAFAEREVLGERLLWAGRPDRRIHALTSFGIWIFAIPWTLFSGVFAAVPIAMLYESYSGVSIGAPKGTPPFIMWFFLVFSIPFIAIGIGMLLAPFVALRKGWRTLYILTGKRLVILEAGRSINVTSIYPRDIEHLSRKENPDGRGTLVIHQGYEKDSDGDHVEKKTELGVVDDVRRLEEMVRNLKDSAQS
jgi:hypothetical protein